MEKEINKYLQFEGYSRKDLIDEILELRKIKSISESIKEGIKEGLQKSDVATFSSLKADKGYMSMVNAIDSIKGTMDEFKVQAANVYNLNRKVKEVLDNHKIPKDLYVGSSKYGNCKVEELNPFTAKYEDIDKLDKNLTALSYLVNAYTLGKQHELIKFEDEDREFYISQGRLSEIRLISDWIKNNGFTKIKQLNPLFKEEIQKLNDRVYHK